jgi:hypothetical protein
MLTYFLPDGIPSYENIARCFGQILKSFVCVVRHCEFAYNHVVKLSEIRQMENNPNNHDDEDPWENIPMPQYTQEQLDAQERRRRINEINWHLRKLLRLIENFWRWTRWEDELDSDEDYQ